VLKAKPAQISRSSVSLDISTFESFHVFARSTASSGCSFHGVGSDRAFPERMFYFTRRPVDRYHATSRKFRREGLPGGVTTTNVTVIEPGDAGWVWVALSLA